MKHPLQTVSAELMAEIARLMRLPPELLQGPTVMNAQEAVARELARATPNRNPTSSS